MNESRILYFIVSLFTRLNILPMLSGMLFFLRCLLQTAKHWFIASEARRMCSCSKVRTASKNKKTQFPMEWYIDDWDLLCANIFAINDEIIKMHILIDKCKQLLLKKKNIIYIDSLPWFHKLFCFVEFIIEKVIYSLFGLF